MSEILISEVLATFEKFEQDFNLGEARIHGVPWWDLVRYPLYRNILVANGFHESTAEKAKKYRETGIKSIFTKCSIVLEKIFGIFGRKSPIWIKKKQIIVFGHPRRKLENSLYVDIYSDPFIEFLPENVRYSVIERPEYGHLEPHCTSSLYYLDSFLNIASLISRVIRIRFDSISEEKLKVINSRLLYLFKYDANLNYRIRSYIKKWKSLYPLMRLFFRLKKPTHVFIIVSAGYEIVIAAAKAEGIQTIELQHGSPARGKLNYDYSSGIVKSTFPDWFVAFGEYWTQDIKLPIKDTKIYYLGFPYFSSRTSEYKDFPKEDLIVIISQKTVARLLVSFSTQLSRYLGSSVNIIYKPHPAEYYNGLLSYEKELIAAGIVVSGQSDDLYSLLARAKWQVGVYSTALYEGVALGAACFIVRTEGSEHMERLEKSGLAKFVHSPDDVDLSYQIDRSHGSLLFKPVEAISVMQLLELTA